MKVQRNNSRDYEDTHNTTAGALSPKERRIAPFAAEHKRLDQERAKLEREKKELLLQYEQARQAEMIQELHDVLVVVEERQQAQHEIIDERTKLLQQCFEMLENIPESPRGSSLYH